MNSKFELNLSRPVMNAAGSLGYAPDPRGPVDIGLFGAFVTNPISLRSRTPARGPRYAEYSGGLLIHSGYPNQGLRGLLRRYAARWSRSPLPIIVHLLADSPEEIRLMVARVETVEGVSAVEIGLPPEASLQLAAEMVAAAFGELPVIARVGLAGEMQLQAASAAIEAGAWAVSLGPPRGAMALGAPGLLGGRLYGPGVFPLALEAVRSLARSGVPVVGAGGVYSRADVQAMLDAGAFAVQLDSVLWAGRDWLAARPEGREAGSE